MINQMVELHEKNPHIVYILIAVVLYLLYRYYLKGITFKVDPCHDVRAKNIGKPLPAYPNGWYVAIRSQKLEKGNSESIDIAGENIVVFRSLEGVVYALEAYCKHLGANLGIGGKVVNKKCIQCPFHGWLYDGESGQCVDYDGKPMQVLSVEYNDDLGQKGKKLEWKKGDDTTTSLRKYPVCELNGYVYVWIHALEKYQQHPQYQIINLSSFTQGFQYRATAIHEVNSHIQDIPQNGSDALHFKYVHTQLIQNKDFINFSWTPKWKRGDDPDIKSLFQHPYKYIRDYRQKIYKQLVENYPKKQYLSVGSIDNFVKLPFFSHKFFVNITAIQVGSGTVFIFLKGPFFTTILFHYLNPKQKYRNLVYHDGYSSTWLPYWISALVLKMDAIQVASDMYVWETKKFVRNIYFKKGELADDYLKGWRQWYSQYYEGCLQKQKNKTDW